MPEDDPYAMLGLTPAFDLDAAVVEQAYLSRVAISHPDLGGGDADAADQAAALNQARRTLLDPASRAAALLARFGYAQAETSLPEGFLAEIMEARMDFEQAAMDHDARRLAHWRGWAGVRRQEALGRIAGLFREHSATGDSQALGAIRRTLNALRYFERMMEQHDG